MNDLRSWLHWATNETQVPAAERAGKRSFSDHEHDVANLAACHLTCHARGDDFAKSEDDIAWCLEHHPEAFRDLCLDFASAVEKMRERVPEAERCRCTKPESELCCHRCAPSETHSGRISPDAYERLLRGFNVFDCPGCGALDGENHRDGCPVVDVRAQAGVSPLYVGVDLGAGVDNETRAYWGNWVVAETARRVNEQIAAADARNAQHMQMASMLETRELPPEPCRTCATITIAGGQCGECGRTHGCASAG